MERDPRSAKGRPLVQRLGGDGNGCGNAGRPNSSEPDNVPPRGETPHSPSLFRAGGVIGQRTRIEILPTKQLRLVYSSPLTGGHPDDPTSSTCRFESGPAHFFDVSGRTPLGGNQNPNLVLQSTTPSSHSSPRYAEGTPPWTHKLGRFESTSPRHFALSYTGSVQGTGRIPNPARGVRVPHSLPSWRGCGHRCPMPAC